METIVESAIKTPLKGDELNNLLQTLASLGETDALVRIWDTRGTQLITEKTWKSLYLLHDRGKGRVPEGTIHPPTDRVRLKPSRRLHKIVKGKRTSLTNLR